jgi:hypothetical protein
MTKKQEGRKVRYSDDELVAMIVEAVVAGGYRSATSWNKAQREAGKGSNDARVRRAWDRALAKSAQARKLVEAFEAERKAERAEAFAKARAAKVTKAGSATKATKATETRKASARGRRTAAQEDHSRTAAEVTAKVNAGERVRARRGRKAA